MRLNALLLLVFQIACFVLMTFVISQDCLVAQVVENLGDVEFFEQYVRPTLIENCLECHNDQKDSGGLSIETADKFKQGGDHGSLVDPDQRNLSLLLQVISGDGDLKMPPDGSLTALQVESIRRWVDRGARWPDGVVRLAGEFDHSGPSAIKMLGEHWAYQPLADVEIPALDQGLDAQDYNEIDRFLHDELTKNGLSFSRAADRRTLIRRATYDLHGLPPSEEEIDAFLNDDSPSAWEKVINRLLESPRYGEKWAKHWLDLARYSDSKGYVYAREERFWVHAWVYRDWVINALNQDMPYDRFLQLQIAADLLDSDPDDLAAMGFLTLGRRFLGVPHDIIDDRIDVVSRATMGIAMACARCHDHKYDPVSIEDYYALYGIFRNCEERLVAISDESEMDAEFIAGLRQRQGQLEDALRRYRKAASDRVRDRIADYLGAQLHLEDFPEAGFDQIYVEEDLIPEFVRRFRDYLDLQDDENDRLFKAWRQFVRLPANLFQEQATQICRQMQESTAGEFHPQIVRRFEDVPSDMDEVVTRYADLFADSMALLSSDQDADKLRTALAEIEDFLFGDEGPCEVPAESITHIERFFPTSQTEELWKLQAEVDRWILQAKSSPVFTIALNDKKGNLIDSHVMKRGDPTLLGSRVQRGFPQAFRSFDSDRDSLHLKPIEGSGRLALANSITSSKNPLTPRVAVNRIWAHHFGAGLVETLSDFGNRSDVPSHPALLDWLSQQLIEGNWKQKRIHRLIMMSTAYQQASLDSLAENWDRAEQVDPENRLLWQFPRRRLDFESLRDSILFVTRRDDFQPGGKSSGLFTSRRRTIYCETDRQFFSSAQRTFDVASPDLSISRRAETTVPQQALFFLNHPFVIEQVGALVGDIEDGSVDVGVENLYRRLLGRTPTEDESLLSRQFIEEASRAVDVDLKREEAMKEDAWTYGMGAFDSMTNRVRDYQVLPHFSGDAWQGGPSYPDSTLGWVQLTARGGHPGNVRSHASIRRWTAPRSMTVKIVSDLTHEPNVGDGVHAAIISSRSGVLMEADVFHDTVSMAVEKLQVDEGDTIDFLVDIGEGLNSDQYLWAPRIIEFDEANANGDSYWDAVEHFRGTPFKELDPWVALAQVLISSNEFIFID